MQFQVYDISVPRIAKCKLNQPPIFEPGLEELMGKTNGVNLSFTDSMEEALKGAALIFLALPTPTKNFGEKKGKAYDLSYTENAIRAIVKHYNDHPMLDNVILVEKSTVPIGTARMITNIIEAVSIR
jgi:UDPglucose 6-dehydrogenase